MLSKVKLPRSMRVAASSWQLANIDTASNKDK
jgi:hypothetical protein